MKNSKRIFSVLLSMFLIIGMLPAVPVSAATLKIKTQPKTSYTAYGSTAKATIKAAGNGVKYTWYVKNANAKKYSKSSVTKSTYSVKMSNTTKNRRVYCVIKDKKGKKIKSNTATLRMKATIITEPKSVSVANGKTAKVSVKAAGDRIKYVWYVKNAGASKYTKSSVKKATYSVTMSSKISGRSVYCVVTDKYGKKDKSKIVSLSLSEPLTITMQPSNTEASEGDGVGFAISVSGGKAPYTYKLKRTTYNGDSEVWETVSDVEILTMGSMTELVFTVSFDEDYYYCIEVTDAAGKKVTSNVVRVEERLAELEIEEEPQVVTAKVGDIVLFSVIATGGTGEYNYQWQFTNDEMDDWMNCSPETAYGVTTSTMTFEVNVSDFVLNTLYRCVVTDSEGSEVISEEVWIEEQDESVIVIDTQPQIVTVPVGGTATFSVEVSGGTEPYSYRWEYICDSFDDWAPMEGAWVTGGQTDSVSFEVGANEFSVGYRYRCVITDAEQNSAITEEVYVLEG